MSQSAQNGGAHRIRPKLLADKLPQNGKNWGKSCLLELARDMSVIALRLSVPIAAACAACVLLTPVHTYAQWWRGTPVDFEACADLAEKAKTKQDKTAALAECNAKFAGRRKPGGGYTYYDFMQNRTASIMIDNNARCLNSIPLIIA